MLLTLRFFGDPILRQKTQPINEITEEIRQLVKDMEETMFASQGIGLAAPQIGKSLSLFITAPPLKEDGDAPPIVRVYINPKILKAGEDLCSFSEGCLSIPGIREDVYRPSTITVEATDLEGNVFQEELSLLPARVFMHENDHINGVLFIDRLPKNKRKSLENPLRKIKAKYQK